MSATLIVSLLVADACLVVLIILGAIATFRKP